MIVMQVGESSTKALFDEMGLVSPMVVIAKCVRGDDGDIPTDYGKNDRKNDERSYMTRRHKNDIHDDGNQYTKKCADNTAAL